MIHNCPEICQDIIVQSACQFIECQCEGLYQIYTVRVEEKTWYNASDVGRFLQIKNIRSTVQRSRRCVLTCSISTLTTRGVQRIKYMDDEGIKWICSKTRKNVTKSMRDYLKFHHQIFIDYIVSPCIESKELEIISKSFKHLHQQHQKTIGKYRVDLLFIDYKIIVECDEFGHDRYNEANEIERTKFLTSNGYRFVRFNPDDPSYNIGDVIFDILMKTHNVK